MGYRTMSGYERRNRNVLRHFLKTTSDGVNSGAQVQYTLVSLEMRSTFYNDQKQNEPSILYEKLVFLICHVTVAVTDGYFECDLLTIASLFPPNLQAVSLLYPLL